MTKPSCGGMGFIWLTLPYITVHHQRTLRQELRHGRNQEAGAKAKAIVGAASTGLLLLACLTCFLIGLSTTSPGMGPPKMDWALPHQSLIKKASYRSAYNLVLRRYILNWSDFLLDDLNFCQFGIKLSSTLSRHAILFEIHTCHFVNAHGHLSGRCIKFVAEESGKRDSNGELHWLSFALWDLT